MLLQELIRQTRIHSHSCKWDKSKSFFGIVVYRNPSGLCDTAGRLVVSVKERAHPEYLSLLQVPGDALIAEDTNVLGNSTVSFLVDLRC